MPNEQGGYGGYRRPEQEDRTRRVRTGGSEPRREPPPLTPQDFEGSGWVTPPAAPTQPQAAEPAGGRQPKPASLRSRFTTGAPRPGAFAKPDAGTQRAAPQRAARPQGGVPGAAPRLRSAARPEPAARPRTPGQAPAMTPAQSRAAARRARELRRRQRRLLLLGTAAAILLLSAFITLLLPKSAKTDPTNTVPMDDKPTAGGALVAPSPYAGGQSDAVQALDWGSVGPQRQTDETGRTYTAAPTAGEALPEFGRVTTEWFADAAFLGDSLTAGFTEYGINLGGALVCGYEGISPNTVVNRTTVTHSERGDEIPLDVLAAAQPAKLYLLIGTNALAGTGNDEGFLNYYARMLDELRAALPNTMLFVQSILPVRPEALEQAPGLTTERVASMNAQIQAMCAERGCYFLDLNAEFSDADGALDANYAEQDGIHLTVAGYTKWVSFLCTHVPYDKDNPYQQGSTYYLDGSVQELLTDLP